MRHMFVRSFFLAILLVVSATVFVHGQGITTGSISGTVEDKQHAVITNAKVTAVSKETNQKAGTETNSTGYFTLRLLPIGIYKVTIEAPSFSKLEFNDIYVHAGVDTALGTQTMTVSAQESLVVEASAPLVDSQSSQITNTFSALQTESLPVGNSFDALALLVPGVASTEGAGFGNNNGARLSVNGQRSRSNNFEIDGQQNNDNSVAGPSIFINNGDVIQELQIVTNFEAQYGRNMGGVINYVTKAGTNQFHGSGFEYFAGSFTDSLANEEKSPLLGFCPSGQAPSPGGCSKVVKTPRYVDNQFGGTVGGPIVRNKIWFFGSGYLQRTRNGQSPSTTTLLTPTPNGMTQLQANFPGNSAVKLLTAVGPTAVKVGNPTFGSPRMITVSNGVTSAPVEFGQISRFLPGLYNDYESTDKVDWQASDKDHVFTRYLYQKQVNTNASVGSNPPSLDYAAGYVVDVPALSRQIALDWTHNFTNSLVNQGRFSYSRSDVGFENGTFPGCNRANVTNCPTRINFGGTSGLLGFGMGTVFPQGRLINVTQWQDNLIWTRGRHTFKFGGEYARQRSPNVFLPNVNGSFTFASFNAFLQDSSSFSLTDGPTKFNYKEQDVSWYFQDDWRIKDNLTFNLGIRWEFYQQATNLLHDLTVARQTSSSPFWDPSLPQSLTTVPSIPNRFNNWGPNVGFAWTPRIWEGLLGRDKTVVRGGFRLAYDPEFYNMFSNVASSAPVVNAGSNIQKGIVPQTCIGCLPTSGGNGTDVRAADLSLIPSGAGINPGARTYTTVAPNLHNPYAEEWTFGIQRQFLSKVAGEVRYNGVHTIGQFQSVDLNPALNALINNGFGSFVPAGLTPCATVGAAGFGTGSVRGHVDCNHRNELQRGNYSWAKYNALQSALRMQEWHGVTADLAYTYSRTIDNSPEVFSKTAVGALSLGPNVFNGNRPERAVSSISFPHVFAASWTYDLPWYSSQKGWIGHILGGWEYNGDYRYSSGQPWTPTQNKGGGALVAPGVASLGDPSNLFSSGTGVDNLRPILSNPKAPLTSIGLCTNPAASDCGIHDFVTGAPTTLSAVRLIYNDINAAKFFNNPFVGISRNTFRGQAVNATNMAVYKNAKVSERLTLQLRVSAYNVFNHQYRGVPDPSINDVLPAFGATFGNNFSNADGQGEPSPTSIGLTRRRLQFGAKLLF